MKSALQASGSGLVVERNREALSPSEAKETILEAGDSLEIVKIGAGR